MAEPYNFIEQYKRSVNFGNAISDNIKGNNSGEYILGSNSEVKAYPRLYNDGEIFPLFMRKFPTWKVAFLRKSNKPLGSTSRGELINTIRSVTDLDNPYTLNAALSAYGYGTLPVPIKVSPVQYPEQVNASDVIKLKQEADKKEEANLVDRWRKKTIADLDITNPLGKTALDVAFYEGPLDWYKRKGFKDTDIKEILNFLIQNGYNVGKLGADGEMGQDTLRAIKQFQRNNGLVADGKFGNLSRSKMQEIMSKRATEEARRNTQVKQNAYNELTTAPYAAPNATVQDPRYFSENRGPVFKIGGQINYQKIFK